MAVATLPVKVQTSDMACVLDGSSPLADFLSQTTVDELTFLER